MTDIVLAGETGLSTEDILKMAADDAVTGDFDGAVEAVEAVPLSLIDELKAVMQSVEHDVSGQAHALWVKLAALVAKVEAAV